MKILAEFEKPIVQSDAFAVKLQSPVLLGGLKSFGKVSSKFWTDAHNPGSAYGPWSKTTKSSRRNETSTNT